MLLTRLALPTLLALITACGPSTPPPQAPRPAADELATPAEAAVEPGLFEVRAVGLSFEGPTEIPSGWTTFRFHNASPMIHFAIIDIPPAGLTMQAFSDELMTPFQHVMDAMNAGDEAAVEAAFGTFPDWVGELHRAGGPGLLSPGLTGESSVFLAPGRYVLECYVKSNGVFHTTSPGPGRLGMVLEFVVTGEENGAPEPAATATVELRNDSISLVEGELRSGANTIRVNFAEQQALPSFVGNDVHLLKVEGEGSVAAASAWMDWRTPAGLQVPSPVTFLGGLEDMPAGAHGYFSVDLEPGDYALMAEVPDPVELGLVLEFSVE